jgi:hypothetical protein
MVLVQVLTFSFDIYRGAELLRVSAPRHVLQEIAKVVLTERQLFLALERYNEMRIQYSRGD